MQMFYVYKFLNKYNEIIYIGRTQLGLSTRMSSHSHLPNECYKQIEIIEYGIIESKAKMKIMEIYLINKYKPIFNTIDKDPDNLNLEIKEPQWLVYSVNIGTAQYILSEREQNAHLNRINNILNKITKCKKEICGRKNIIYIYENQVKNHHVKQKSWNEEDFINKYQTSNYAEVKIIIPQEFDLENIQQYILDFGRLNISKFQGYNLLSSCSCKNNDRNIIVRFSDCLYIYFDRLVLQQLKIIKKIEGEIQLLEIELEALRNLGLYTVKNIPNKNLKMTKSILIETKLTKLKQKNVLCIRKGINERRLKKYLDYKILANKENLKIVQSCTCFIERYSNNICKITQDKDYLVIYLNDMENVDYPYWNLNLVGKVERHACGCINIVNPKKCSEGELKLEFSLKQIRTNSDFHAIFYFYRKLYKCLKMLKIKIEYLRLIS